MVGNDGKRRMGRGRERGNVGGGGGCVGYPAGAVVDGDSNDGETNERASERESERERKKVNERERERERESEKNGWNEKAVRLAVRRWERPGTRQGKRFSCCWFGEPTSWSAVRVAEVLLAVPAAGEAS